MNGIFEEDVADSASAGSSAMAPVVGAILGNALETASRRAGTADLVHGLIAGLRLLRTAVEQEVGYAMAAAVDSAIRTRLLVDNLGRLRLSGVRPLAIPLPEQGPQWGASVAIFENAARSCLAVNAHADDNEPLEQALFALTAQLLGALGGAPDWAELRRELRAPADGRRPVAMNVLPAGTATVH